jgi:hypothetical protein
MRHCSYSQGGQRGEIYLLLRMDPGCKRIQIMPIVVAHQLEITFRALQAPGGKADAG